MTGDGTIIARFTSVTNPLMSKLGLIMQETLSGSSKMASVYYDNHYQYLKARMSYRTTDGGGNVTVSSTVSGLPIWLKLTRSGNVFTGYASSDGETWSTITSGTIAMSSTVYVGLLDTSRNTSQRTIGAFDNVSLSAP